ncbi:MAG: DUF2130 domain-containing protein, partial [Clostridia bacterium]|nr:DUF2130 domain-containing protein [Clostridia bacterium]
MKEIKCPHCGQSFTVDEAGYAAILSQVRTAEFDKELHERLQKETDLAISNAVAEKNEEINRLKMAVKQLENDAEKNSQNTELAVTKAVNETTDKYNKQLDEKRSELEQKNQQIIQLEANLEREKVEGQLAVKNAVSEVEKERDTQKAEYEAELKKQKELTEYYKDLKARQSTKMIGETLEQHCEQSFNMIRAAAFRNAYFEKDNDVVDGTKGDYIYRETDDDGIEIISIMFEMKNEMETTAAKHKNESFFKKLDEDRKKKKCEYAVLVSMLESDSDFYNQGIVDVSYKYEKMYVIRPQFFIPMITILRNAALNSMEYKKQVENMKNQEIDITDFEEKIETFKK